MRFGENGDLIDATVVGATRRPTSRCCKVDPSRSRPCTRSRWATPARVQVGDPVIAIGNPFGFDRTVTTGIVSALQRQIQAPNGFTIDNVIQTDAAINPGNSGGPLLDANGQVIGINSQIATGRRQRLVGIGFAIPINTAKGGVPQLEKSGRVAARLPRRHQRADHAPRTRRRSTCRPTRARWCRR